MVLAGAAMAVASALAMMRQQADGAIWGDVQHVPDPMARREE